MYQTDVPLTHPPSLHQVDDGWCEGTLNGVRALFPDNFVEMRQPSTSEIHVYMYDLRTRYTCVHLQSKPHAHKAYIQHIHMAEDRAQGMKKGGKACF